VRGVSEFGESEGGILRSVQKGGGRQKLLYSSTGGEKMQNAKISKNGGEEWGPPGKGVHNITKSEKGGK